MATATSVVLACAGIAWWAQHNLSRTPDSAQFAFVTSLQGVTAPCGCTSRPLGGLDLLAATLESNRQREPTALVALGPTFFDPSPASVGLSGHRRATAGIIADVLARLTPAAVFVTPEEKQEGANDGQIAPWVSHALPASPVTDQAMLLSQVLTVGGHRAGLIAARPSQRPVFSAAAISQAAAALKEAGCTGVLLAFAGDARDARAQLAELEHVDLVIAESQGALVEPETLGSAMLVDAGARGEHVGMVRLVRRGPVSSTWQWDDGGEATKRPLLAQRARFTREAESLPDGPGKQARLARVQALDEQLNAIVAPTIDGIGLQWSLVPLDIDGPRASWATQALLHYNDGLCDVAMAETAKRTCPSAANEREQFVGNAACQACHQPAFHAWQQSKHAQAWATLESVHKTCDVSCVGCHVVGWEQPGGFCHLADSPPYQNVGCENCHGPGAGHIAAPTDRAAWGSLFVRDTPEATCRSCHNAEHSDQFDFAVYRPRIVVPGHGLPLPDAP